MRREKYQHEQQNEERAIKQNVWTIVRQDRARRGFIGEREYGIRRHLFLFVCYCAPASISAEEDVCVAEEMLGRPNKLNPVERSI